MAQGKMNILNSVFTKTMLNKCLSVGHNDILICMAERYKLQGKTYGDLLKIIYKTIKKEYRNEYYYKNTLLNKLLLGVHSVRTTTALTELPIANSKADFILINGKAVVYEIKTELDNIDRLENQINDYYKAFDHVAVVTYEKNIKNSLELIQRINKPVGVYCLRKSGVLSTVVKPLPYRILLDKGVIFSILRKHEYEEILRRYYTALPDVSSFVYYKECKKLFLELPMEEVYQEFLSVLKKRIVVDEYRFKDIPYEIKFLAYFNKLKINDYHQLTKFLSQNCGGV